MVDERFKFCHSWPWRGPGVIYAASFSKATPEPPLWGRELREPKEWQKLKGVRQQGKGVETKSQWGTCLNPHCSGLGDGVLISFFVLIFLLCFVFVNLTQPRVNWKEGTSTEESPRADRSEAISVRNCHERWLGSESPTHFGWRHP